MKDSKIDRDLDARPLFPPNIVIQVKALACELPHQKGIPLSRFSCRDIAAETMSDGICAQISDSTVWRWLHEDAIKPWQYRSWIFPRDAQFEQKAARVLDLYHGFWEGKALQKDEFVLSADEKTSVQARRRKHPTYACDPQRSMRVEHEYERMGALNYLAAWDVHRAKIFGHIESKSGIESFDRLVTDVMHQEPYASAKRVFWIVDNGSSHRGQTSVQRFHEKWPQTILVHLPVHASWLNQIEIYFSILQRKVLTPNDFTSLELLANTIIEFQKRYECTAQPFEWKFTHNDLANLMSKLSSQTIDLKHAA